MPDGYITEDEMYEWLRRKFEYDLEHQDQENLTEPTQDTNETLTKESV